MSLSLRTPPLPLPSPPLHHPHFLNPLHLSFHSQTHHNFPCFSTGKPRKTNRVSDAELASDFSAQVEQMNTKLKDTENALKKSMQMLFSDLCSYLDMNSDEVKTKWGEMSTDEKLGLVIEFVSDWGVNFHPLSPKSVRDLVDEYLMEDTVEKRERLDDRKKDGGSGSDSVVFLPRLKKLIMGLSPDS